jgi:hypothetical protein
LPVAILLIKFMDRARSVSSALSMLAITAIKIGCENPRTRRNCCNELAGHPIKRAIRQLHL